jgi:hypothetical protein
MLVNVPLVELIDLRRKLGLTKYCLGFAIGAICLQCCEFGGILVDEEDDGRWI